ncbi:MAG: hypothetical protein HY516_02305 [Candidatus Aenigmarchaeota archaeon]|nr:hypothetical protein [Candidatus Aenigmarchaeota archaeon]
MFKGVTPVIATVMLILITVGVVGLFYGWSSGLFNTQIEKSVIIPSGAATCNNGLVTVRVQNIGSSSTVTDSDIIVAQIAGRECTKAALSIAPGQAGVIINAQGCGAACATGTLCSGNVEVRVGTRTGVVESTAFCA